MFHPLQVATKMQIVELERHVLIHPMGSVYLKVLHALRTPIVQVPMNIAIVEHVVLATLEVVVRTQIVPLEKCVTFHQVVRQVRVHPLHKNSVLHICNVIPKNDAFWVYVRSRAKMTPSVRRASSVFKITV